VNIWKENVLENLEIEELKFPPVGDFLAELKKEFGRGDNELAKVVELKKIEQRARIIEDFMQKFRRIAQDSEYKE